MKITHLSETSGAAQIQAKQTQISFESFSASLTDEEKKAPSFFDWSDKRLAELATLYFLDHVQSYEVRQDALKKANIMLSHFMFNHHLESLVIEQAFTGSKDQIKQEHFALNIELTSLDKPVAQLTSYPQITATLEEETGEEKHYQKFNSLIADVDSFTSILNQLKQQVSYHDADLKTQKRNELELLHAAVFIIYLADDMSVLAAANIQHIITGLTNNSGTLDEATVAKLDNTQVVFHGTMSNEAFNLTWTNPEEQAGSAKPKLN
jgi:hypothetical protein